MTAPTVSPSDALLPCPFCGDTRTRLLFTPDCLQVECSNCCAAGPAIIKDDQGDYLARSAWNTRAALAAMPPAGDAPDIDAIRKRCEAAAPGPWKYNCHDNAGGLHETIKDANGHRVVQPPYGTFYSDQDHANVEFLTKARKDIPALLAYITALNAVIADQAALAEKRRDEIEALRGARSSAEECARVAEEMRGAGNLAIAAAIRESAPSSSTDMEGE